MYDNSTPIGGKVSSTRGNLIRATKSNPCPHCGKPDWCYFIGELSVCNRDQPPATGWEATSKTDKEGKIYYARPQEKKPVRPAQTRYWEYPDRDGSPLIRVRRIDFGDGVTKKDIKQQHWDKNKKDWVYGWGDVVRDSIPIYRYAEVQEAIAQGKPIFLADGEQCADILWHFNCATTTSIGGMGKVSLATSKDLQGAKVVIVPDRDEPGIKDAEKAAEYFPEAKWLYPFPDKDWERLPKSDGLDIFDWIGQGNLSPSDIRAMIGEKKVFKAPAPAPQAAANVVRPTQFQVPPMSELKGEIETLLESGLRQSELRLKFIELAQKFRVTSADVLNIYKERQQELEEESNLEDLKIGIQQLLASQSASVKLSDLFPESLAAPIEEIARRMNLKPECYALALISGISRFLKNGSSTMLVDEWNYWCRTHGYFGAMIAESSQMKTPVFNAMITDPLAAMRKANQEKFKAEEKAYKEEFEQWKNSKDEDKGSPPDAPVEKLPYITKATWEGIAGMVGRAPTQGILWLCDELAGFFKSANQYRSGRGSDQEDLLECWSGNGAVIARAAGTTVNVGAVSLSIYGNIQPKVLAPFLGDGSDDNGTFARFDFVQQPRALTQITLGLSRIDINPMLQALYERVDAIPLMQFELDKEAKELFVAYYNHCQRLRFDHPKQGMRAMLGKAAEKVGRVATILHCIHAAHFGSEVSPKIPASRVRAAIKWVEYTTQQALSINIEVCSPDALDATHTKILNKAREKGGSLTADQTKKLLTNGKHRPETQKVVEWFEKLAAMNYGEVTRKGRSIIFSLCPVSPLSPLTQNQDTASVTEGDNLVPFAPTVSPLSPLTEPNNEFLETKGDTNGTQTGHPVPFVKPLSDISYSLKGDKGDKRDTFPSAPDNVESQMLSCTTESAGFTDEALAKIFADKMREAIANSNFERAKEIVGQVNISTFQLRGLFWQNLERTNEKNKARLLAFANLSEGAPVKYVGKIEQYAQEKLTAYDADGHGHITCLLADGRGFTTWIPTRDLWKL